MNIGVWYLVLTLARGEAVALREVGPFHNERACMTAAQLWLQTVKTDADLFSKKLFISAICTYSGATK